MAQLTPQKVTRDGVTVAFSAASAAGDIAVNGDRTVWLVSNTGAGAINVSVVAIRDTARIQGFGNTEISDIAVAVGAGALAAIFVPRIPFNAQGKATLVSDTPADTEVAVLEIERP